MPLLGASGAALYAGTCTGHGTGTGSSHHPGLGGGVLPGPPCPLPSGYDPRVVPQTVLAMNATTLWPPTPQLPLTPLGALRNVVINGILPIVDLDLLTPHPTPTIHTVTVVMPIPNSPPCTDTKPVGAYWCTLGPVAGREAPTGHPRKALATSKSVWINGRRAARFGDPLGDGTPAFPCNSFIMGCSPNVFIGN